MHAWFEGDGWGNTISGPLDVGGPDDAPVAAVAAATQQLADHFAARIREHPADWHMLQRLWLADLPARPAAPEPVS